jgi:protein phosphatase
MTDIGMYRSENQDYFKTAKAPDGMLLAVVCDGMGGAAGGSTASRMAGDEFCKCAAAILQEKFRRKEELSDGDIRWILSTAAYRANLKVYTAAATDRELFGMGTTLTGALIREDWFWVVNVGDSRAYQFRRNRGKLITHDHSYVQYLVDTGRITAEEARTAQNRNIITRAVGTESSVDADVFVTEIDFAGMAAYALLCSDGLSNHIAQDELAEILSADTDVSAKADTLVSRANNYGGTDNITAVVIKLENC